MAKVTIDEQRLKAGREYYDALVNLGLDPEGLFWAKDTSIDELVLVLVTRQFDHTGPFKLSDLLFKAYNANATPREIDPFIIRLHSPDQSIVKMLANIMSVQIRGFNEKTQKWDDLDPAMADMLFQSGDLQVPAASVYKFVPSRRDVDLARQWRRFDANIQQLAA